MYKQNIGEKAILALVLIAVAIRGCESIAAVPTVDVVSQTYGMVSVAASDGNDWIAASATLTGRVNEVVLTSVLTTKAAKHYFALFGLTAATNYEVTVATAEGGTNDPPDTAFAVPSPTVSFCTEAEDLAGLMVDDDGTTTSAIKIKWTEMALAAYKVYLDGIEVGDVNAGTTEFLFDATSLEGKSVTLNTEKTQTCKVEAILTVSGCTDNAVKTSTEIECGVEGASGDDEKCNAVTEKLATWMFVLSASIFFSMKKITSA